MSVETLTWNIQDIILSNQFSINFYDAFHLGGEKKRQI